MGAWGTGPFENDGAGDFEAGLSHAPAGNLTAIGEAFEAVLSEDYLEVDAGQAVIAAAAVVAALVGPGAGELPKRLREWLAAGGSLDGRAFVPAALDALDAITKDAKSSEIYDLWKESDSFDVWLATVETIRAALKGA